MPLNIQIIYFFVFWFCAHQATFWLQINFPRGLAYREGMRQSASEYSGMCDNNGAHCK